MSLETLILAALVIPLIGSALILLTGSKPNLRETMTLATAALLFYCVASIFPAVMAGARPSVTLLEMLPGLTITFTVEPLGMIFAGIASFLWIVTTIYSIGYMRGHHEKNQTRFYFYFAISIASVMGIAFAGNMMTLFIFYEVLTLCTFPLVTHHGTEEAKKAGRVYLGILIGTSIGFQLLAIVWTWVLTGTLDFREGGILAGKAGETATIILLLLYVFGIGKAAVMPLHRWLPAAMVAPTPVSALLHAVAVVKAGVFTVLKVFVYIFGVDFLAAASTSWLVYLFGLTILVASIIAMRQDNLKRRLAYSTVSQLSYVLIGAAILAPISVMGAAIHIAAHAFGKITLFFAAGSILVASHKTEISQMAGIGRRMPWTMGAFAIGSLSMIGLPPTAGFISKWFILQGALETQQFVAVGVIIASTLLNAGYFLPIVYAAFFKAPPDDDGHAPHGEGPALSVLALTLTATCTVLFFFYPNFVFGLGQALVGSLR
jgi:multicomponent Na+:H+ antiporter subunit D